jgi:S1-C subfamily serine protease
VQAALGSGVIVQADGVILTNHHVIDGAQQIKVELSNHRIFDAKVLGSDPPSDLAVLKIESKDLAALSLADSDRLRVGDIALGSVIRSALDRRLPRGSLAPRAVRPVSVTGASKISCKRVRPSIKAIQAGR